MAGKTEYKNQWLTENRERFNLVLEKGKKAAIQEHIKTRSEDNGESVNSFVNRAIDTLIEQEGGG